MRRELLIGVALFACVFLFHLPVLAQEAPESAPHAAEALPELPPEESAPALPVEDVSLSLDQSLRQRGSFKFADEDLRTVLRSLARSYGFNVTLAPEVNGRVTIDFVNVEVINAIDTILRDQGFGYIVSGDIVRVTTLDKIRLEQEAERLRKEQEAKRATEDATRAVAEAEKVKAEAAAEPLEVRIFRLKYIDAEDAKQAIESMISGRGAVTVLKTRQFTGFAWTMVEKQEQTAAGKGKAKSGAEFERSTTLIVQDTASVIARIASAIEDIDHKPYQILIIATIVEVPIDQKYRLGINWTQALNQWEVGAANLAMALDKGRSSTRLVEDKEASEVGSDHETTITNERGSETTNRRTTRSIRSVEDGVPSSTDRRETIRDAISKSVFSDLEESRGFENYVASVADTLTRLATTGETYSAVLSAAPFNLMLSAMKTDSNIAFLSHPRVIVQENYAAQLFVGMRYPILKTEVSDQGGASGTSVDEWREIGIVLKVIPQVRALPSGDQSINMIIHPAVSSLTGKYAEFRDTFGNLAFSSYPIINMREADTNVTINNGDTIVIGGLITSDTVDAVSKIPLLGDIPILGYLFKEKYTSLEKKNILIFITARIVDDSALSPYEKMMLEKSPFEALEDVRFLRDDELRPHLYLDMSLPESAPAGEAGEGVRPLSGSGDNSGPYLFPKEKDSPIKGEALETGGGENSRARERIMRR